MEQKELEDLINNRITKKITDENITDEKEIDVAIDNTIYFNENVNFDDDESFIDELTLQEVFFKNLNKIWKQKNL